MAKKIKKGISSFPVFLIFPALGWFIWFLMIPLTIIIIYSFSTKGIYGGVIYRFQTENYSRVFEWVYVRILWSSFKLAGITTLCCLFLGYPMAYVMATTSKRMRSFLMILVVLPFWTSFVVRAFATKVFLGDAGPLNSLLLSLKIIHQPIHFINTDYAIWIGMVTNYLPFMVLPLYVVLEKFDFSLIEAARDLGASTWSTVIKILIPLTKSGIVTGCIFVFTPALGEFVIPDLLGGAKTMLMGNLITEQFLKTRDWPFGSALSLMVIGIVLVSLVIYVRSEGNKNASA